MSIINTRGFCRFWPVSWTITHRFRVPKRFPRLTILTVRLRVHRQHSQYWPILTRFMDHYSPFWGPKAISIVVEPQGALTCRSSTLALFLDSDPYHGILLNFGVPKRFPWLSNPKVHLRVGHQHSQFWPILARFVDYYYSFGLTE